MSAPAPMPRPEPERPPAELQLALTIRDAEVIAAIHAHPDGRARDEFVRSALRIGVLALEQARGRVDVDAVRREGERLVESLERALGAHQKDVAERLSGQLKDYFDPQNGRFHERVQRLVSKDGELEQILRRLVGQQDSELTRTLSAHLGDASPLMRSLDPATSTGVVASLSRVVEDRLGAQRDRLLVEFSLDNADGALARLVREVTERHGRLESNLKERIDEVRKDFSLDQEGSALSRLVAQVDAAQKRISAEFSLDNDASALARMQGELRKLLEQQKESSASFQSEVKIALEAMKVRRAEADRSTTHGLAFEQALHERLLAESRKSGDVLENVSATPGVIARAKQGDFVMTLSSDCRAAGARIVIEAKESGAYDVKKALDEIEAARKNRSAEVGLFMWSSRSAPQGIAPLTRHGNDVVVIWDAESEASDAYLLAALSLARALCTRAATSRERASADLEAMDKAIREIERQAESLDEIRRSGETIKGGAQKILDRARIAQEGLARQVTALDGLLADLRVAVPPTES